MQQYNCLISPCEHCPIAELQSEVRPYAGKIVLDVLDSELTVDPAPVKDQVAFVKGELPNVPAYNDLVSFWQEYGRRDLPTTALKAVIEAIIIHATEQTPNSYDTNSIIGALYGTDNRYSDEQSYRQSPEESSSQLPDVSEVAQPIRHLRVIK